MKKTIYIICIFSLLQGCIESFEAETQVFEGVLVVDARLTDEEKQHQVLLSRARPFEQDSTISERNANVRVKGSDGITYNFSEVEAGKYLSAAVFEAKQNTSYQLEITTANGKSYISEMVLTPEKVALDNVYVEQETNEVGDDGVGIFLDTGGGTTDAKYLRYEYEETYKIIAPSYDPFEFDIIDDVACVDGDAYEVGIKQRTEQQRVCFGSNYSTSVIQTSTDALTENTLSRFPIRFIDKGDFIISHRYSMLVRQHAQTLESYSYFEDLEAFSSSESVFTDTQAGFLAGNIASVSDSEEKVIGYFQVTSVTQKRVFFNYTDFFPEDPLPEYPINCENFSHPRLIPERYHCTDGMSGVCDGNCTSPLIQAIKGNQVVFFAEAEGDSFEVFVAPYFTKPRACGDCTVLGSNIQPEFWVE
ncbi:MAG: DUF4249 domain-containing protein [Maribacter sp.]|uniref:DUF4249 domain-containing protein n=1 Tax=Maribacter sp. TaxID=1897614 RepID=UPI003298C9C7